MINVPCRSKSSVAAITGSGPPVSSLRGHWASEPWTRRPQRPSSLVPITPVTSSAPASANVLSVVGADVVRAECGRRRCGGRHRGGRRRGHGGHMSSSRGAPGGRTTARRRGLGHRGPARKNAPNGVGAGWGTDLHECAKVGAVRVFRVGVNGPGARPARRTPPGSCPGRRIRAGGRRRLPRPEPGCRRAAPGLRTGVG